MSLRFLTGGESHGPALVIIVDGMPAGLPLSVDAIDRHLARRQRGHGRGGRMNIESDRAQILSGVRFGRTMGSPISLLIENRDHASWDEVMSVAEVEGKKFARETRPRPGHADLAGMLKYGTGDARDVLERASARETAARTAAGAVARRLLEELGSNIASRVVRIGSASAPDPAPVTRAAFAEADSDPMRCSDPETSRRMVEEVDTAAADGDSLGGIRGSRFQAFAGARQCRPGGWQTRHAPLRGAGFHPRHQGSGDR